MRIFLPSPTKDDLFGSAKKLRRGVERKLWLARVKQARLYFERARAAVDNIKVVNPMQPTPARH